MADKTVKTHTSTSNREKPQGKKHQAALEKKVVFKSVLDNPYRIQWPKVPENVQNLVFSHALSMLEGMGEYATAIRYNNRKRKRVERAAAKEERSKKQRVQQAPAAEAGDIEMTSADPAASTSTVLDRRVQNALDDLVNDSEPPPAQNHVVIGINNVTKRLEKQTERVRYPPPVVVKATSAPGSSTEPSAQSPDTPPTPILLVLVCRADVDPPILIDHIPHLVAAHNSSTAADAPIKLVCLPKAAELTLANAVGLRRVAVLAFDADTPGLTSLADTLDAVPTLAAAWLACKPHTRSLPSRSANAPRSSAMPAYIPTHVKQVKTTAPKDMRAAKERRVAERKEAKARRKEAKEKDKRRNPSAMLMRRALAPSYTYMAGMWS
ncbi:hypothetical protein K525DRAFT_184618 [Schizophyllum commune Loenen D]|nr:hypothetical protein K525DRAFT_184618 [Schizophyllum commune Loenen D]